MDYIKDIVGVAQIMIDISLWRLLVILICIVVCIFAWKSPELLKAFLDYKKSKGNE